MKISPILAIGVSLSLVCVAGPVCAQEEFLDLSLEELLNVTVTSAIGREQDLEEVSNAMYVITKEDIARSGARKVEDLFYRVPGMQVRKVEGHRYLVSIRSQPYLNTSDLLVLIDGVIVFNPTINGTVWQTLPINIQEIERIEIIRGPGGVLYSSNAVNGVINIITKSAKDQERYAALKAGTQEYQDVALAGGVKDKDENHFVRGYYQYEFDKGLSKRRETTAPYATFGNQNSRNHQQNVGVRYLHEWSDNTSLSLTSRYAYTRDFNAGAVDGPHIKLIDQVGLFVGQFKHQVNDHYDFHIQFDQAQHILSTETTSDTDAYASGALTQHNVAYDLLGAHLASFGAEWKRNQFNLYEEDWVNTEDTQTTLSYFFQDEYKPNDSWIFTAGTRVDRNSMVPPHIDKYLLAPRFSAIYSFDENKNIRLVASRTYRMPSFYERSIKYVYGTATIYGNPEAEPETTWTYETGYSGFYLNRKLKLDADIFFQETKDKLFVGNTVVGLTGNTINVVNYNKIFRTVGSELSSRYKLNNNLTLIGDYSYVQPFSDPEGGYEAWGAVRSATLALAKHQLGAGFEYTQNKLKIDGYFKWISKHAFSETYTSGLVVMPATIDRKYPSVYKIFLRLGYEFKMPWMSEEDAEFELMASDFLDARQIEDFSLSEPEVSAGIKIRF